MVATSHDYSKRRNTCVGSFFGFASDRRPKRETAGRDDVGFLLMLIHIVGWTSPGHRDVVKTWFEIDAETTDA
jgi:hypothetical protein